MKTLIEEFGIDPQVDAARGYRTIKKKSEPKCLYFTELRRSGRPIF